MVDLHAVRKRLAELAALPAELCDLAEAALLIAAEHGSAFDLSRELAQLDAWAQRMPMAVLGGSPPETQAKSLIGFVRGELGFAGNESDYYDPRNSYLPAVLERRTGIPITLAIIYIELGRRAGIPVRGVAFPGHFLVKVGDEPGVMVDPFHGEVLSLVDCEQRIVAALGPGARLQAEHLAEATPREIIVRMLRNLKHIHLARATREDTPRPEVVGSERAALACCDRIVMILPDEPTELRDRGLVHGRMGHATEAYADLERALELAPDAPWADSVRQGLPALRHLAGPLN